MNTDKGKGRGRGSDRVMEPFLVERAAVERVRGGGGLLSTVEAELSVQVTVRCGRDSGRGAGRGSSSGALCVTEGGPLPTEMLSLLAGAGARRVRFSVVSGAWLEVWGPPPPVAGAVPGAGAGAAEPEEAGATQEEGAGDNLYMQTGSLLQAWFPGSPDEQTHRHLPPTPPLLPPLRLSLGLSLGAGVKAALCVRLGLRLRLRLRLRLGVGGWGRCWGRGSCGGHCGAQPLCRCA
ncbi:hypothetical protein B484DRAFT_392921 [Ochromonadaceae sp. CCMP2298]|nr:hypothetical protein B484DRAFT_392921 [Ochromonadaceae sp. CCMP2298]